MRQNLWLCTPVAVSVLVLTSCGDPPTQPTTAEQRPATLATAPARDTWIKRTPDPVERIAVVAADVPNAAGQSVLYVIGGWLFGVNTQGLKVVEAYNVATDTWTPKRDLPMGLSYINGAGVIGGKIYIAGGYRRTYQWSAYAAFVYDPAKDTWTRLADMPVKGGNGVAGVIGDKLYVSVPFKSPTDRSHFLRYDPATNTWATLPSPKHAYHMGGVLYGKLYLVGNQTEAYDPATNRWTAKAPPPSRSIDIWGSAAAVQAKLYVVGEGTGKTLVYAPLSDSWIVRPNPAVGAGIAPVATRVFVNGRPRIEVLSMIMNYQYVP